MQASGKLQIPPGIQYDFTSDDLQDLGEIGRGAYGAVNKMIFRRTNTTMAGKLFQIVYDRNLCCYVLILFVSSIMDVLSPQIIVKRIRSTVDEREQKQLLMDLEVIMKSNDCNYIVQFYGALFKEVIRVLFFFNISH